MVLYSVLKKGATCIYCDSLVSCEFKSPRSVKTPRWHPRKYDHVFGASDPRKSPMPQAFQPVASLLGILFGAGGGGRTRTVSPPRDFESRTSANSITPACQTPAIISYLFFKFKNNFWLFHFFQGKDAFSRQKRTTQEKFFVVS